VTIFINHAVHEVSQAKTRLIAFLVTY